MQVKKQNIRPIINFYNEEYKQFSQNKNFQSISSVISGVKPTSNKALFTVLDDNITSFQKVEVLSNATALKTEYLGGSSNIDGVIINIAVDYVGSNNLTLLDTEGYFESGKLAGTANYKNGTLTGYKKCTDGRMGNENLDCLN
jgi:DNA topoisomerase-2